jgi:V/A-type H+-transporting ATPase subunit K
MLEIIGRLAPGLVLGIGGLGSCFGIWAAGTTAAGAWASEGKAGKKLSFQYVIFVAAPISQTLYSMILMTAMLTKATTPGNTFLLLGVAVGCGVVEALSAYYQGVIGASGIRCLNENGGKGFGLLIIAIGIIETAGIFAMVFGLTILKIAQAM